MLIVLTHLFQFETLIQMIRIFFFGADTMIEMMGQGLLAIAAVTRTRNPQVILCAVKAVIENSKKLRVYSS